MNEQEVRALLTYANQIDARIQLNEATSDTWLFALGHIGFTQAKYCVKLYYATTQTNHTGNVPVLTPAELKKRTAAQKDIAVAQRSAAIAAPVIKQPEDFRAKNPERWDELFKQGQLEAQRKATP